MYITNKIGVIIALCCATFMGVAVYATDWPIPAMFLTTVSGIWAAVMAYNAPEPQEQEQADTDAPAVLERPTPAAPRYPKRWGHDR